MQPIVRYSKVRHVFGEEQKLKFDEVRPSNLSSEGHLIKSNGSYVAFSWEISGGGALCLLSQSELGRISPDHALIKGHSSNVLDFDFNPFHEQQILTSSEDTTLKLWEYPVEGVFTDLMEPRLTLRGHQRKVGLVTFNPAAAYISASAAFDYTVKVWNMETAAAVYTYGPLADVCLSLQWDVSGQLLGTTWRDKKARILDPRTGAVAQEFAAHEGGKAAKFCWIQEKVTCFTCGFSKQSERQYALWDVRQMAQPLIQNVIDQAAGVLMPFYDPDTGLLFLAGKGDGNIRFYEVVNTEPYIHFIESYKSAVPCKGVSFIPKRKVDVTLCEVMRAVKLTKSSVEMISFRVPRKGEGFQEDIYPDCIGLRPGTTASAWVAGVTSPSPRTSMRDLMAVSQEHFEGLKLAASPQSPNIVSDENEKLRAQIADLSTALAESESRTASALAQVVALEGQCEALRERVRTLESGATGV